MGGRYGGRIGAKGGRATGGGFAADLTGQTWSRQRYSKDPSPSRPGGAPKVAHLQDVQDPLTKRPASS